MENASRPVRKASTPTLEAQVEAQRLAAVVPPPEPPQPAKVSKGERMIGSLVDGRYRIEHVLAEGGMGIVYDGVHVDLGRRVALKALAKKFTVDPVAVTRFRNEARLAGALGHPNIVEVFDMGTMADGAPYLVMEKLEGETLGQRLKRDRFLPIDDAVQTVLQILSALAATHERGIVHRDLKPENVFLSRRLGLAPVVKLLDFGISKVIHPDEEGGNTLTRAGFVMGTPSYMAPEQARGDRDLDGRVDLYAVGVLAYEMLLGRLPFTSKMPAALIVEMQKGLAKTPRQLRPEVPEALEKAVLKLLSFDRAARFKTAGEAIAVISAVGGPPVGRSVAQRPFVDDNTEVTGPPRGMQRPPQGVPRAPADADSSQKVQIFSWNDRRK